MTKSKAQEGCSHNNWECLCKWDEGHKLYGDAPIEMLHDDGMWAVPVDDLICQFISSPIALLPDTLEEIIIVNRQCSGY